MWLLFDNIEGIKLLNFWMHKAVTVFGWGHRSRTLLNLLGSFFHSPFFTSLTSILKLWNKIPQIKTLPTRTTVWPPYKTTAKYNEMLMYMDTSCKLKSQVFWKRFVLLFNYGERMFRNLREIEEPKNASYTFDCPGVILNNYY